MPVRGHRILEADRLIQQHHTNDDSIDRLSSSTGTSLSRMARVLLANIEEEVVAAFLVLILVCC